MVPPGAGPRPGRDPADHGFEEAVATLAYLFWHRPRAGVDQSVYEARLAVFHAALGADSRAERVRGAPWMEGDGYVDWYFVIDWAAIGALNEMAVTGPAGEPHSAVAELAGWGAGGVMELVTGGHAFRPVWRWLAKRDGEAYPDFYTRMPAGSTLWRRQLVLGPPPEFAAAGEGDEGVRTTHELVWAHDTT